MNKLVDIFAVTFYQSCTFEKLPSPLLSNDKLVKLKVDPQKTTLTLKKKFGKNGERFGKRL